MANAQMLEFHHLNQYTNFDLRWKGLTRKANDAFNRRRYSEAIHSYDAARTVSHSLFHISSACNGSQANRVVEIMAISAQNAARNFKALRRLEEMERELERTAEKITSALHDKNTPYALKTACVRQLPHYFAEYKNLLVETNRSLNGFTERFKDARIIALSFWTAQAPSN